MLPRTRRHLAGHPFVLPAALDRVSEAWWRARPRVRALIGLLAATIVLAAGVTHAASSPDGPPVTVWVAARDLHPGDRLEPSDTRRRDWPSGLAPDGVVDRPTGTVTAPLPRGAVVTDRHLGDTGVAASVPPGTVALPVPIDLLPAVTTGTRVDLVGAGPDGSGARLADDAVVIHHDGEALWVAVRPDAAVAVSAAVAAGSIAAVVLPP